MTPKLEIDDVYKLDRRNLIKMGNSAGITLHKDELRQLGGLEAGDEVTVLVKKDGTITIKPDE